MSQWMRVSKFKNEMTSWIARGSRALALVLVLSSFVVACVKPSPKTQEELEREQNESELGSATFYVGEVKLESTLVEVDPEWKIPSARTIEVKACVTARREKTPILGHRFVLSGAAVAVSETPAIDEKLVTDKDGCVRWSERFSFDHFSKPRYVRLERKLKADGVHSGERVLKLGMNPWFEGGSGAKVVADLNFLSVKLSEDMFVNGDQKSAADPRMSKAVANSRALWVDSMMLSTYDDTSGSDHKNFNVSLSFVPKVEVPDERFEDRLVTLQDGKYRAELIWVGVTREAEDKPAERVFLAASRSVEVRARNGKVLVDVPLQMRSRTVSGQVELAMRITPIGAPGKLQPFEGVSLLGDYNSFSGVRFTEKRPFSINRDDRFLLADYLKSVSNAEPLSESNWGQELLNGSTKASQTPDKLDAAPLNASAAAENGSHNRISGGKPSASGASGLSDLTTFEVSPLAVDRDGLPVDSNLKRTIGFRVKACLYNPQTKDVSRDVDFKVVKLGDEGQTVAATVQEELKCDPSNEYKCALKDGNVVGFKTDAQGCVRWADTISHQYYASEQFVVRGYQLQHGSGYKKSLKIRIQPWEDGGRFAVDGRDMDKNLNDAITNRQVKASSIFIKDLSYTLTEDKTDQQFSVDEFLNLHLRKKFLVQMTPQVSRYGSIANGLNQNEFLRSGLYLLRTAIQGRRSMSTGTRSTELQSDRYNDPQTSGSEKLTPDLSEDVVSVTSTLARVNAARVSASVWLKFHDLRLMRTRNYVYVQLLPVNEDTLLANAKKLGIDLGADQKLESLTQESLDKLIAQTPDAIVKDAGLETPVFRGTMIPSLPSSGVDLQVLSTTSPHALSFEAMQSIEKSASEKMAASLKKLTNLESVLQAFGLEYLPLKNQGQWLKKFPQSLSSNRMLQDQSASFVDQFLARLNRPSEKTAVMTLSSEPLSFPVSEPAGSGSQNPISAGDLEKLVVSRANRIQDPNLASKMCVFWLQEFLPKASGSDTLYSENGEADPQGDSRARFLRTALDEFCLPSTGRRLPDFITTGLRSLSLIPDDVGPFLLVEPKLRVTKVGRVNDLGGRSVDVTVDGSFGTSISESKGASQSISFNPMGLLGLIPHAEMLSMISPISVGMDWHWSQDKSRSSSESTTVTARLKVEKQKMQIELLQYERCTVVRINPAVVRSTKLMNRLNKKLSEAARAETLSRGILICEGRYNNTSEPRIVKEDYFFIGQDQSNVSVINPYKIENQWTAAVRGVSDYATIMSKIRGKQSQLNDIPSDWEPIDQSSIERLDAAFAGSLPSYPGLYFDRAGGLPEVKK